MTAERKNPVWPWIAVPLIWLPIFYVVSFGPACQLSDRGLIPDTAARTIYHPLGLFLANCRPETICNFMIDLGMEDGVEQGGLPPAAEIIFTAYRGSGQ